MATELMATELMATELVTELVAPELVAPELVATELVATELVAPELVALELVALELVAPELVATELIAPELVATELVATELVAPELVAPELVAPELVATELWWRRSEARDARRERRGDGSEAVGARRRERCPKGEDGQKRRFPARAKGLIARWNRNQGKGWCAGFPPKFFNACKWGGGIGSSRRCCFSTKCRAPPLSVRMRKLESGGAINPYIYGTACS